MGDAAHQARPSDHNLGNAADLTHDPDNGVDCNVLAEQVKDDPRTTYTIWNRKIFKRREPQKGWQAYTGSNPHTKHMHVSIRPDARTDMSPWPWSPQSVVDTKPILRRGDRGVEVELLQCKLGLDQDGIFGPKTEQAVKDFQASRGLTVDGIVGPATWAVSNPLKGE